jgi:hypothetical protein
MKRPAKTSRSRVKVSRPSVLSNTGFNEVTAVIWLENTWRNVSRPNPHVTSAEIQKKQNEEIQRADVAFWERIEREQGFLFKSLEKFYEDFGTPRSVREGLKVHPPKPAGTWPCWNEPRDMIAVAMGAAEPKWVSGSWWHDPDHLAWDRIESVEDVKRIVVPDWRNVPAIRRMLESRERWQQEHPSQPTSGFGFTYDLTVPGRPLVRTINYPAFVDLGVFLMGMTRFLTILGGDHELGGALMDKCFELSTGYVDFLMSVKPEPIEGLCGFGGDTTCMLSPALYPRYGAAWDARLFEHVRQKYKTTDDLPCNLHSCGPSGHLYELWGKHPYQRNITTLQTRLLPGRVGELRESLPDTQLELTIHPPHFDAVRSEPAALKELLLNSAREAGYRNVHLIVVMAVHRPNELAAIERNVTACHEALEEIRKS